MEASVKPGGAQLSETKATQSFSSIKHCSAGQARQEKKTTIQDINNSKDI